MLSVASLAFFRKPLMRRFSLSSGKPVDRMEGERALVIEDVAPGGVGKAEMRGARGPPAPPATRLSRRASAAGWSGSRG